MSTTTTTRHETAMRFLAALAGSADRGELLELRYRLDDGQRMGQVFDRLTRLRGLATRAIALGRRRDVYVGCAPRTRRHGGRDAVARAFLLWADCDGDAAVAALDRFDPAPSIVVASGTGSNCHAYWPLTEPLARDDVERANRRLAHALGADLASADAARILRVPSTWSHKHRPPTPVDALRLDPTRRFAAVDVVGRLPDPPAPRRTTAVQPEALRGDDPLLGIAPDVYVPRLLGVEVPRHRKVPCPFHPDRHASLHVYDTAARGWYCFGRCRRGGTIYDLAAPLYGHDLRGDGFLRLRAELRRLFGLDAA
jgi:RepB DNA-primase from phage plasmid